MRWQIQFIIFVSMLSLFMVNEVSAQKSLYDFSAKSITGEVRSLAEFKGKVALVVNTASQCGYTGQYEGLEKLHETFGGSGFVVLGFPSNDFGGQEPGTEPEIQKFCSTKFGVTFPLFAKTKVTGPEKSEVYDFLIKSSGGQEVEWNFEKFIVGKDGKVLLRLAPSVAPLDSSVTMAIKNALAAD